MHVVWTKQPPPDTFTKAIFLAGPTPRQQTRGVQPESWRKDALAYLESQGWDGVVFVPEPEDGDWRADYVAQVEWEEMGLRLSDCIVFWIPRELEFMPAFTTNIEWGMWYDSGKVVLGSPVDAPKMKYINVYADKHKVPRATTLPGTLDLAIERLGEGAARHFGERAVRLDVWSSAEFQQWYQAQRGAGNKLDDASFEYQIVNHSHDESRFAWAMKVDMHVTKEARNKSSEVIFARPNTSSVVAWAPHQERGRTQVVLVSEFRSASCAKDGLVLELPGGSDDLAMTPLEVAVQELHEETGVLLDASRFTRYEDRQAFATLLTHRAHLFGVELTPDDVALFAKQEGVVHGSCDSERTLVHVMTLDELLMSNRLDWTNLGMILQVVGGQS